MESTPIERSQLNQCLLQAHREHDEQALISIYTEAGNQLERVGDIDAACFYLTHAYIYALELGAPELSQLHARLGRYGRVHDH